MIFGIPYRCLRNIEYLLWFYTDGIIKKIWQAIARNNVLTFLRTLATCCIAFGMGNRIVKIDWTSYTLEKYSSKCALTGLLALEKFCLRTKDYGSVGF